MISKHKTKSTISLCMIVRDEQDFLADCLASAARVADEMIVVDTGSSDRTIEIAELHGAKIHNFEWTDSYSDARNHAIGLATGDWILILDADERLDESSIDLVPRAVRHPDFDAYLLLQHNYCSDASNANVYVNETCRLFRNRPQYRYKGRVHEHVIDSVEESGGRAAKLPAIIHHLGNRPDIANQRQKHERYMRLLEEEIRENPTDLQCLFQLGLGYRGEEPNKSAEYFERAAALIPPTHKFAPIIFSHLADVHLKLGNHERAIELYVKAIEANPNRAETYFGASNALYAIGEYRAAADTCEAGLLRNPMHAPGFFTLGNCYTQLRAHESAAIAYRQAAALSSR